MAAVAQKQGQDQGSVCAGKCVKQMIMPEHKTDIMSVVFSFGLIKSVMPFFFWMVKIFLRDVPVVSA